MIKFPSFAENLRKHRLTSVSAWHSRVTVWAAAALAGLCVVGFTMLTDRAIAGFAAIRHASVWWTFLVAPAGGMAIVWMTRRFAPGAAGSGIPQVMTALDTRLTAIQTRGFVSIRLSIIKALLAALALLCGFSIGREGPSVQIAAGILHGFRARFGPRSLIRPRDLILAGGAAGIAAAFNAPLAGIVFAIEELSRRFEQRASGLITTAIIIGGVVAISLLGNYTYFGRLTVTTLAPALVMPAILCVLAAGLLGGLFSRLLLVSTLGTGSPVSQFRKERPIIFAGLCGLAVAVLDVAGHGAASGSGYQATRDLLAGAHSVPMVFMGVKFMATWISYWSGIPGGIFAPCLAIGAGLGNDVATWTSASTSIPLIALGMVGFLAAVTQAPLTSFIIVMEMIDGHAMVLSLMASALLASLLAKLISPPLYSTLSHLQLAHLGLTSDDHD